MSYISDIHEKPLVIRASAGTGKTYRLSLEFINLLLKYRINFDEILVITFTKKATAEIRERIFLQLKEIVNNTEEGMLLKQSIRDNINPDIQFNETEMNFLQATYQSMITDKSSVKISTIDSFVNTVFSGIIAPYYNITDFSIDNKINTEILPEIYDDILKDENLSKYEDIFLQAKRRNLDQFIELITGIIENRWLFEFADLSEFRNLDIESEKEKAFQKYASRLKQFLDLLQTEILKKDVPITSLLQSNFSQIVSSYLDLLYMDKSEFSESIYKILSDRNFIDEQYKLLLEDKNIWNGNRIRSQELKDIYPEVQNCLAEYLYFEKALTEQFNIISLAADILHAYDEIKFRDKIFTHSDISYYTFRFLYDKQLSIVDKGNVLNIFYEQLSYNTRFVLIDEFQDTSVLQWSIFYPILKEITSGIGQKEYGRVIVVGDEKQAIYGWRGGERRLLTDFEAILNEPVNYDTLTTSYRSKPVLMKWLNKLFKSEFLNFVEDWDYTEIDCAKDEGGFVQIDFRNSTEDEHKLEKDEIYSEFVENNILPYLKTGRINPAETAILMRKNKELEIMAQVLEEQGVDFTLEMSGSLFQHRAIKPILFVLNFLVYDDFMELIKFLRSDLVMLNPEKLNEIITAFHSYSTLDEFLQNCKMHPYLSTLYKLKYKTGSLLYLLKSIMEEFGFSMIFSSEVELKNLQRFLEVVDEFERSNHEYVSDVSGFLEYCRAISEKDEYSQIGQSLSNSIKLLTIHKSKGLQFETVYTVFDVTGKAGGSNSGLRLHYKFADDFRSLDDFAFTYNYNKVLQKSQKKHLIEFVETRNYSDELNNIYVALTRAKNNLFIYLYYNKKGNLGKLIKGVNDEDTILKNITKTIYQEFSENLNEIGEYSHQIQFGEISTEPNLEDKKTGKIIELPEYFKILKPEFTEIEAPNLQKLANEFLKNKSILIGNIVHDYLSYIKYNLKEEIEIAEKLIISKYGSLIPENDFIILFEKMKEFIGENDKYFNENIWDRIFNEFVVYDKHGKEYRIDRMMVDTSGKNILIIDYKTGSIKDEEQLDRYKAIVENLPIVERDGYKVEKRYLKVGFNN